MAARSPSGYTNFVDDSRMHPRGEVRTTGPSAVIDDQVFLQGKDELLLSDCFHGVSKSSTSWAEIRRYWFPFDLCDGSSTCNAEWTMLCWSLGAGENFDVSIYHHGRAVRHTYSVVANLTSKIWRAWTSAVIYSDGTENEVSLEIKMSEGYVSGVVAGVGLYTDL